MWEYLREGSEIPRVEEEKKREEKMDRLAGVSAKLVHLDACNYNIIPEIQKTSKIYILDH